MSTEALSSSLKDKLAEGVVVADRFRLEHELGRGGMGSVWRAHHIALDVPCALKFIHDQRHLDPESQSRFTREARAAAKLRCPQVVQMLDHGIWSSIPYIAMELLEGEPLTERIDREGTLSLRATHAIVADVARALGRAEQLGIVHRDLKPDNIFLVPDGDREQAKVLDFGVAKLATASPAGVTTQTGAVLGTPYYMSPEQAHGAKALDHRSDLWSLGIIAFECVTGEMPFYSEGLGDLLRAIMFDPLPVPSRIVSSLPPAFDDWFERACDRDPDARFQSAGEMSEALQALVESLGTDVPWGSTGGRAEVSIPTAQASDPHGDTVRQSLPSNDEPAEQVGAPREPRIKTLEGQSLVEPPRSVRKGALLAGAAALAVAGMLWLTLTGAEDPTSAVGTSGAGGTEAPPESQTTVASAPPPAEPSSSAKPDSTATAPSATAPHSPRRVASPPRTSRPGSLSPKTPPGERSPEPPPEPSTPPSSSATMVPGF